MKYFLILNPGSRGNKSKKSFHGIFSALNAAKTSYEYKIIENMDEARVLSAAANKAGFDVVAVAGGDGTINNVINGFYNSDGTRNSRTKLGVIYTGTSPDFCKSYDIPYNDIDQSMETLLANKSKPVKVGKITFAKQNMVEYDNMPVGINPEFMTGYFACCANIGLGASIAKRANSGIRNITGDFLGTFLSMLKALFVYRANDFTVKFDDEQETLTKVYNIFIGKTVHVASGIKINNELLENDDRFYSVVIRSINLLNLPGIIKKIYSGKKIRQTGNIRLSYNKTVDVCGNFANPGIEFDGDPQGFLPCRIEPASDSLDVIVKKY
jgi:diacylglycerol kinase family enzyme